jgi:GTP-binding protein
MEPLEHLTIDIPEDYMGAVMDKLGTRKAEMINMTTNSDGYLRLEFKIPSRGLIGYRSQFMTDTKGNGVMHHLFHGYEPFKGDIPERQRGSLVAFESGETSTYGLFNAQERGELFLGAGEIIYEGMIVGENAKTGDLEVNVCKKKHVTNMRASGTDEAMRLTPPRDMSLENCLEFIAADELVEVTPKSIRLRKRILDNVQRAKQQRRNN